LNTHLLERGRALASASQQYQYIRMSNKAKLIGVCAFLLMALGSCVMVESSDYPASWPSAIHSANGQCPKISGRYRSRGACAPEYLNSCQRISLKSAFFDWPAEDNTEVGPVDINDKQPNVLEIKVNSPGKPSEMKRFLKGGKNDTYWKGGMVWDQHVLGYSCSKEGLSLEGTVVSTATFITTVGITTKRTFNKLPNGDLIMQEQVTGGGYGVGIPIFVKRINWVRWAFIQQLE
jgi:hypothetical protein